MNFIIPDNFHAPKHIQKKMESGKPYILQDHRELYLSYHNSIGFERGWDALNLIRAYKVVNEDYGSPEAGRMNNKNGRLFYHIGQTVVEPKKWINRNAHEDCGTGLHVATKQWCVRNYVDQKEYMNLRLLMVEFEFRNIIAVPFHGCGKIRVKRLSVIKEIKDWRIRKVKNG